MTIDKWIGAFADTTTKGLLICSSNFGTQLRAFGSDLALWSPATLFMAHEWINAACTCALRLIPASGLLPFPSLALSGLIMTLCSRLQWKKCTSRTMQLLKTSHSPSASLRMGPLLPRKPPHGLEKNCFKSRNSPANIASTTSAATIASLSHPRRRPTRQ